MATANLSSLAGAHSWLYPAMYELRQHHPGVGHDDEFDLERDCMNDTLIGRYYNARLKMSESATIFERWELTDSPRTWTRHFRPRMLALVDKVYDRVSVARLIDQATVNSRRPGTYRPGCYRPAQKPRLVRSNPLLEKINVRMAA